MVDYCLTILQAASNGKHVNSCLEMLVSNFTPPYYFVDILKQPRGLARKDQVLSRVHSAFKHIADLVPLAPTILSPIVSQRMPIYAKEPVSSISTSLSAIQFWTWYSFVRFICCDFVRSYCLCMSFWVACGTGEGIVPLENPHVNLLGISLVSVSHAQHC